jgi:DNA invertase Pin-like site-specific DNA recombinase
VDSKNKKQAIELVRVSTAAQAGDDRAGIPAQKAANRRTAAQHDLEIVSTIEISDVSGAAVLQSPEMQKLLNLIASPTISGVVAKEFSRLMRPENFCDYALLQAFVDTSTVLYLPEGPIDFSSKTGRLFGPLRAAMAGIERTEILERSWSGKEAKRRAGKHPQGQLALPYGVGYKRDEQSWYYKPEAEKVSAAFAHFLTGETGYTEVGREVGIAPFNLRNLLRNPIYTGWRVYTKRRDPSAKATRVRHDGKQGDRPKIQRSVDEIIRVKVLEPLVSEEDFQRVQNLLDLKKENHWRARPEHQRRFTYSGFLRCGVCGNLVYTHAHKPRDWYVCKSRTYPTRKHREAEGLDPCTNPYMRREHVESALNSIFSQRMSDSTFLERLAAEYVMRSQPTARNGEGPRLRRLRKQLGEKRKRIIEAYLENLVARGERDRRLDKVDSDIRFCEEQLSAIETEPLGLSPEALAASFAPFQEWEFLGRTDKRRLLQATVPEIYIKDYAVTKLAWMVPGSYRDKTNHTGTDSSPPPA